MLFCFPIFLLGQINFQQKRDSLKRIYKTANNYEIEGRIYEKLMIENETKNFLKAIEYGEKAVENVEKSGNKDFICGLKISLAFMYMRIGYSARSIQLTQELMKNEIIVKNQDFTILTALFAMNYMVQGDYEKALRYQLLSNEQFDKDWAAHKNYDQRGYYAGPAKLAEAYEMNNNLDSAYKYGKIGYERLFKLKMEPWSQDFNWENRWIYGKILQKLSKYKDTLLLYNDAMVFAKKLNNYEGMQSIYLSKANLYNQQNQIDSTLKYGFLAFKSGSENYNYKIVADAGFLLKEIFLKKKEYKKAIYFNDKGTIAKDSLINIKKSLQIQNLIYQEEKQKQLIQAQVLQNKANSNIRLLFLGLAFLSILAYIFYKNKSKTDSLNKKLSLQNIEIE